MLKAYKKRYKMKKLVELNVNTKLPLKTLILEIKKHFFFFWSKIKVIFICFIIMKFEFIQLLFDITQKRHFK